MFDHIGLKVRDVVASTRFYEKALTPLGLVATSKDATSASFGPRDAPKLYLNQADGGGGAAHLAFEAKDRAAVDAFWREAKKAGGTDHGAPGIRADYGPSYYAAFVLDPDGNNVEAVCLR